MLAAMWCAGAWGTTNLALRIILHDLEREGTWAICLAWRSVLPVLGMVTAQKNPLLVCIDFVQEDIGQILSNIECDMCFSIHFIWLGFVLDVKHVVTEMRLRHRFSYVELA